MCDVCGAVCVECVCGMPIFFAHFKVCVVDVLKYKRRSSGLKQKRSHVRCADYRGLPMGP